MSEASDIPEDQISPVEMVNVYFLRDFDVTLPSKLTGKILGPALQGQVKAMPEDVAKEIIEKLQIAQTTELTPNDVEVTLWQIFASIMASARLVGERFKRSFYSIIDGSLGLEPNKERVAFEARRLASLFAPIPLRVEATPLVEKMPGVPVRAAVPGLPSPRIQPELAAGPMTLQEIEGRDPIEFTLMQKLTTFQIGTKRYIVRPDTILYKGRVSGLWTWDPLRQKHNNVSEKTVLETLIEKIEDKSPETLQAEMSLMFRQGYSLKYIAQTFHLAEEEAKKMLKDAGENV